MRKETGNSKENEGKSQSEIVPRGPHPAPTRQHALRRHRSKDDIKVGTVVLTLMAISVLADENDEDEAGILAASMLP